MRLTIILSVLLLIIACKGMEKQSEINQTKEIEEEPIQISAKKEMVEEVKMADIDSTLILDHYICYIDDNNPNRRIWISFTERGKAIQVKYFGQQEGIDLVYKKEESWEGGAHPTIIKYYDEIYNGKVNGQYELMHSGIWDYALYIRGKDSKKFRFTIDLDIDQYGPEPCF